LIFWLCIDVKAQNAYVYYSHAPSLQKDARLIEYIKAGDNKSDRKPGLPPVLKIRKGSQACFVVQNPNPLLYTYSVSFKTISPDEPEEITKFISQLSPIVSRGVSGTATANSIDNYLSNVDNINKSYIDIQKARLNSDNVTDFSETITTLENSIGDAETNITEANDAYGDLDKEQQTKAASIRAYQLIIEDKINTIKGDVSAVKTYKLNELQSCVVVGKDRMVVTLSAVPKIKEIKDQKGKLRPIDSLASFTVSPQLDYRIAPALLLSYPLTNSAKSFAVKNGVVVEQAVEFSRPILPILQVRDWLAPIWGAVGVRPRGTEQVPDLFLGIIWSPIESPSITLGFGATFVNTPVALSKGGVGLPLPADVEKLDDIVERKYLPGFGFTLTIGSLKLSGN